MAVIYNGPTKFEMFKQKIWALPFLRIAVFAAIVAIVVFVVMFALVITEKIERHIATMLCGAAALIFVLCHVAWTSEPIRTASSLSAPEENT